MEECCAKLLTADRLDARSTCARCDERAPPSKRAAYRSFPGCFLGRVCCRVVRFHGWDWERGIWQDFFLRVNLAGFLIVGLAGFLQE